MFAALVHCKQYPGRLLPIVADSAQDLFALGQAITSDVPDVVDNWIKKMGSRKSTKTGVRALFLELVPGISYEMKAIGNSKSTSLDKLLEAAPQFIPPLVEELNLESAGNTSEMDIFEATAQGNSPRKKLSDRLQKAVPHHDEQLNVMGRMLFHFAHTGEQMRHFTD